MNTLLSFEKVVASHRSECAVLRAEHFVCHEEDRSRAVGTPVHVVLTAESQREQASGFSSNYVGGEYCIDEHLTVAPGFECAALRAEHSVCHGEDRSRAVEIPFGGVLPAEAHHQKVPGYSPDCVGRIFANQRSPNKLSLPGHQLLQKTLAIFPGRQLPNPYHQLPDTVGKNLLHQFAYRSVGSVRKLVLKACHYHRDRSMLSPRHANPTLKPCAEMLLANHIQLLKKNLFQFTSKNHYH